MAEIEVKICTRPAFRRPVEDHEIEPYLRLLQKEDRFQVMLWKRGLKRGD